MRATGRSERCSSLPSHLLLSPSLTNPVVRRCVSAPRFAAADCRVSLGRQCTLTLCPATAHRRPAFPLPFHYLASLHDTARCLVPNLNNKAKTWWPRPVGDRRPRHYLERQAGSPHSASLPAKPFTGCAGDAAGKHGMRRTDTIRDRAEFGCLGATKPMASRRPGPCGAHSAPRLCAACSECRFSRSAPASPCFCSQTALHSPSHLFGLC